MAERLGCPPSQVVSFGSLSASSSSHPTPKPSLPLLLEPRSLAIALAALQQDEPACRVDASCLTLSAPLHRGLALGRGLAGRLIHAPSVEDAHGPATLPPRLSTDRRANAHEKAECVT
jgi:hypothetical protein